MRSPVSLDYGHEVWHLYLSDLNSAQGKQYFNKSKDLNHLKVIYSQTPKYQESSIEYTYGIC